MPRNSTQHVCPQSLKGLAAGILICLTAAGTPASAQTGVGEQLILVYNWAKIPANVLAGAEGAAARIFQKAGVRVRFVDCDREGERCSERLGGGAVALNLARDTGTYPNGHAMGFSAPAAEGGTHAVVLYDRVERFAALPGAGVSLPQILGLVIGHELGHLLLTQIGHSPNGLMHSPWSKSELSLGTRGALLFTAEQAATMQEQMRQRTVRSTLR